VVNDSGQQTRAPHSDKKMTLEAATINMGKIAQRNVEHLHFGHVRCDSGAMCVDSSVGEGAPRAGKKDSNSTILEGQCLEICCCDSIPIASNHEQFAVA
jgi:hypothetical protein